MNKFYLFILKSFDFNRLKTSYFFWLFFIITILIHVLFVISTCNWNYLGSLGALLTVFSLLCSLKASYYPKFNSDIKPPCSFISDKWIKITPNASFKAQTVSKEYALEANKEHNKKIVSEYSTLITTNIISTLGTVMWAYSGYISSGDLTKVYAYLKELL
ncbi:hypothetical protein [Pseudoalteromonas sp. 1181_04]|uniref:hypothetical protein n=1 Tax=Pseudoalteromonas sp. 1181_04 TaxID=2604450 RepID=UPI0040649674